MKRSVIAAVAAAALAIPAASWAQEHRDDHSGGGSGHPQQAAPRGAAPAPGGRGPGGPQGGGPQGGGQPYRGPQPGAQTYRAPQGGGQPQGPWHGAQPGNPPQGQAYRAPPGGAQPQGPWHGGQPGYQGQGGDRRGGDYHGQPGSQWGRGGDHFDRRVDPGHWNQVRDGWRGEHGGWDRGAAWHVGGHDWWRGRPEFRGYYGRRDGFWFAPGFGYYSVPGEYWGRHWGYGEYLPRFFWRYSVSNYWAYGLPAPPFGCAWVWVDGGLVLVDLSDGYILETQYGVY